MSAKGDDVLRPLHRRVALVAACAVWAGVEMHYSSGIWETVAIGVTVYAVWDFFLRGKYRNAPAAADDDAAEPPDRNPDPP